MKALGIFLVGIALALLGAAKGVEQAQVDPIRVVFADTPAVMEQPVVKLPRELREWNWGGGSCVHASTVMVLRWSNNMELADWWRKTYSGGESYGGLTSKLTKNKVPWYSSYADGNAPPNDVAIDMGNQFVSELSYVCQQGGIPCSFYGTASGDERVLDRCIKERRGATIFYKPNHSIMLVHIDTEKAIVLDNNAIEQFEVIPRATFIKKWHGYGGVAVVPVIGTPRPPLPRI